MFKNISFIKYSIPVGLAVLSHQVLIGAASFAKVESVGLLELLVPAGTFAGCVVLINRFKKKLNNPRQQLPPPPNYDEQYSNLNNQQQPNYQEQTGWDCDKEFFEHEYGVKYESFSNGVKRTEYELRRRSNTW
jgi:hypothetical protein